MPEKMTAEDVSDTVQAPEQLSRDAVHNSTTPAEPSTTTGNPHRPEDLRACAPDPVKPYKLHPPPRQLVKQPVGMVTQRSI
jgi:hypothetical protein